MVIKASKAELKTSELALPKRRPSILAKTRSSESLCEGEPGDGGDMRDVWERIKPHGSDGLST